MSLSLRAVLREYIEGLVVAVVLALLVRHFVFGVYKIPSDSMAPTLLSGDFILAFKLPYGVEIPLTGGRKLGEGKPERNEVVVFRFPKDVSIHMVKRVVGLPGDRVEIKDGKLWVNENAANSSEGGHFGPVVVPPGHVFVLGDNGLSSEDSRNWGAVPTNNIVARVSAIWLSLDWSDGGGGMPKFRTSRIGSVVH